VPNRTPPTKESVSRDRLTTPKSTMSSVSEVILSFLACFVQQGQYTKEEWGMREMSLTTSQRLGARIYTSTHLRISNSCITFSTIFMNKAMKNFQRVNLRKKKEKDFLFFVSGKLLIFHDVFIFPRC
jgi:hypothetical protein